MYALLESILEPIGGFRTEMYCLTVHGFNETTTIELQILDCGDFERYTGNFTIHFEDGEEYDGVCMNRKTKEDTLLAVEDAVVTALVKKYRKGN